MTENEVINSDEALDKMLMEDSQPAVETPGENTETETVETEVKDGDSKLAQEALEATAQAEEAGQEEQQEQADPRILALKVEEQRLLNSITGLRGTLRDITGRMQNYQNQEPGQNFQQTQIQQEESPLEKFAREHPDDVVPATVTLAESKFQQRKMLEQQQINQQQTQNVSITQAIENAASTITDETHGVGLSTLTNIGSHLLTQGDRILIAESGSKAGQVAYERLKNRVIEAGGPIAQLVQKSLKTPNSQIPKTKSKTVTQKVTQQNNEGGAENVQVDLHPNTRNLMRDLGFGK